MEQRPGVTQPPPTPIEPPPLGTGTAPALRFVLGAIVGMGGGCTLSVIGGALTYGSTHRLMWVVPVVLGVLLLLSLAGLRRRSTGMFLRGFCAGAALSLLVGTLCSGSMAISQHPARIAG